MSLDLSYVTALRSTTPSSAGLSVRMLASKRWTVTWIVSAGKHVCKCVPQVDHDLRPSHRERDRQAHELKEELKIADSKLNSVENDLSSMTRELKVQKEKVKGMHG